ncbi:hypothetical protein K461DRAFT_266773 [Myriangium duriaei CBS 260.36]|uniref:Piwi domain-containing protein n=1 Tax=Myriangium duriaei CBS 260.36 TaxID=1168546 RepID=A0A9P4J1A4_9PEZI|nr:hypothetical protein K461DRAFT_266773 [Myriangium duriaei CBS 260.36]
MVVGIDVTHPSYGSLPTAPSVAAVVASTDAQLGQFPGVLRIQDASRREMVSDLIEMIKSRLELWERKHKTLPENVLVYRDGVSEGQYETLRNTEIKAMTDAFDLKYPKSQREKGLPRMTVIVVGKRHHTRFYPTRKNEAHQQSGNTKSGTVVDRGVTRIWDWDFFLQAHTGLKGTAKPAH